MPDATALKNNETEPDFKIKDMFDKEIAIRLLNMPVKSWAGFAEIPKILGTDMETRFMDPNLVSEHGCMLYDVGIILSKVVENHDIRRIRAIERVTGFFDGIKNGYFSMPVLKQGFLKTSSSEPNYKSIEEFCNMAKMTVIEAIENTVINARDSELGSAARAEIAGTKKKALTLVPN